MQPAAPSVVRCGYIAAGFLPGCSALRQGNWADFSGRNTSLAFPAFGNSSKIDAFACSPARSVMLQQRLFYVKGGAR